MEKKKLGNGPFYAAMAVCLLAAGVGTWQVLRPSRSRVSAPVSAAVLPAQTAPLLPSGSDTGAAVPAEGGTAWESASGSAALPRADGNSDGASSGADRDYGSDSGEPASGRAGSEPASGTADGGSKSGGGSSSGTADSGTASSGTASSAADSASKGGSKSGGSSDTAASGASDTTASGASDSASASGTADASASVCSPLEGKAVAAFSMERLQYNETLGDWRTHDGLDIGAELGTAVAAACAGTVASVTEDPLMGVTVTLRHEGGYETTYAGLQETSREAGDTVPAGAVIGTVGDTAAAEAYLGPHLHFSVRHGGVPMDPEDFLSGA